MTRENYNNMLGWFQRHKLLPERPLLVDVGCCQGWFTESFLNYFPAAECIGIDLDARAEKHYQRFPNARFIHAACDAVEGVRDWWMIPGSQDVTELGTLVNRNAEFPGLQWVSAGKVRTARLDQLVQRADFIKIDAELMDLSVLAGATGLLLSATPPVGLVFELVGQTLSYTSDEFIVKWFQGLGYRLLTEYADRLVLSDDLTGCLNVVAVRDDLLMKVLDL